MTRTPLRLPLRPRIIAVLGLLAAFAAILCLGATGALAAGGSAEISIIRTNGTPQNSGAATQYSINFSCSGEESASCGEEPTIRIPLELTSALPNTPAMDGGKWAYKVTSGVAGLVKEEVVENGELVIKLDPTKLISGESDTVQLSVTPPNGLTPNGTKWSLSPTFSTDEIPATPAPAPATGEATAKAQLAVSKKTLDEGAVYVRGHQVIFNITAQCSPGASTGKLFMTEGSLVDQLPAGLEYVSATPAPTKAPPVGGSGEIAWTYGNAEALPTGCGDGSKGSGTYQVVANVPAAGANQQKVENTVVFTGTPIDQAPTHTEAKVPLTLINEAPEPGELGTGFLNKTSLAPLCVEGAQAFPGRTNCYAGTFPGNWIRPINPSPSFSPGGAEGSFEVTIAYPASRAYETDLVDPMPCLGDETAAGEYSSPPIAGAVSGTTTPACAEPAFHPTVVWVSAPSLGAAVTAGWQPKAILKDGSRIAIATGANGSGGVYFDIPAAQVAEVVAIELPPNANLTDNHLKMVVFGYADGSLQGGDTLRDVAVASAYPIGSATAAGTSAHEAKIYIEPTSVQLGIKKTFGGLSNGPGGKSQLTTMNLVGSLAVPTGKVLPGNVVLADLLPEGMAWSNPAATGSFTVQHGLAGTKTVAGTITRDPDYQESGRELIRVSLPKAAFEEEGGGFFTIKPPANFFRMEVPNETKTFNNSADLFVAGIGRETQPVCGAGEGTGVSEFESKDELDLSGDGEEEVNYCQSSTELKVAATGGPNFSLKKFVQGNLDAQRKGPLGIGKASRDGTGVFTLEWANNGSAPLEGAVIYDILPYVGDTGVDQGQSGNPRGSEFATEFVEVLGAAALPAGVTVEYSTSSNPCRPEVNPAAVGCVEDWSATVPGNPATVKSLRFASTATYAPGASFTLEFKVKLPHADVNDVAWNSAATDAKTTAGLKLAPAEPPKVGITAPAGRVTPTVSTTASEASILPEREVHDAITIGGTNELNGTVNWKLLGPVAPQGGSCSGLNWAGAATADNGSFPFTGDTTQSTASTELTAHGCYAYEAEIKGTGFETVTSPAGSANELVLVHPSGPTVETTVSAASVLPETAVTDSVKVAGTEGFGGTVTWKLFGPVAPQGGSCEAVEWNGAATAGEGSFPITGNTTQATAPTTLAAHGCYGYEVTLAGEHLTTVTSPVGSGGEVLLVHPAAPAIATQASSESVLPGTEVADAITVTGTEGFAGSLTWRLAGPVAPAADGSCVGLDWSTAATVADGELAVAGDLTEATPQTALTEHGCYGYEEVLEGEHLTTATSPLGTPGETVLVHPAKPTLATTASPGSALSGAQATDKITIGGTAGFAGTVHWKLVGPVGAANGNCAAVDWNGAAVVAQGDLPVSGDGDVTTPATDLKDPGCYGYAETIEGQHLTTVSTAVGEPGETVLIGSPPATPPPPAGGTPDLTIVKRVDAKEVEVGKPLHFTIEVQNKGTGPATKVVVTDKPVSPLAFVAAKPSKGTCGDAFPLVCRLGTLAAGAKVTIEVTATPTAGGKVENDATVSSLDEPGAGAVKAAAAARAVVPLRLSKTVTPHTVEAGGRLHYAIVVSNPTAATAKSLQVCDRLPAGLAFVSSSLHAVLRKGAYCWEVPSLKGHATLKIQVVARALAGAAGRLVNTATLTGPDVKPLKATAAVRVKPLPVREGGVTG